jgi:hypothetical protein
MERCSMLLRTSHRNIKQSALLLDGVVRGRVGDGEHSLRKPHHKNHRPFASFRGVHGGDGDSPHSGCIARTCAVR